MLVDQTFSIRLAMTRYFVTVPGFSDEGFDGERLAVLLIINISSKRFDACSSGVNGGTLFFFFFLLLLLLFRILSGGGVPTDSEEENPRGVTICLHIFSLNILFVIRFVSYVISWFSLFVLFGKCCVGFKTKDAVFRSSNRFIHFRPRSDRSIVSSTFSSSNATGHIILLCCNGPFTVRRLLDFTAWRVVI